MNKVLRLTSENLAQLQEQTSHAFEHGNLILILCAAWCGTSTTFKSVANELALLFTNATFIWLDIEDDCTVAGEIDVANFPSIAVFRDGVPVHYGVSLPHQGVVKRLLKALLTNPIQQADVPEEVAELPQKLSSWVHAHA